MERDLDPTGFNSDYLQQQVSRNQADIDAQIEEEERQRKEAESEKLAAEEQAKKDEFNKLSLEEKGQANLDKLDEQHAEKDSKEFGINENIIEFKNAIKKGVITAADGALTAPERWSDAAKGEDIGDPNYRPEWDPMKNVELPLTKTWWGPIVEGIAHYGTYGVILTKGLAVTAPTLLTKIGVGGVTMSSAALGAALSKNHDDHNMTGLIVKNVPEMGVVFGPLATKEADHPLIKKFKNVVEEMGTAGVADRVMAKWFGLDGVEQAVKRNKNVASQTLEKGKDELAESIVEETRWREMNPKNQLPGEVVDVDVLPDPKQIKNKEQLPPSSFRGHKNKPIAEPHQGSPNSTGSAFDIKKQLDQINDDPSAAKGSTDSPMTPLQAERMSKQSGLEIPHLEEKVKELIGDYRYQQALKEARRQNKTMQEYFSHSFKRMQEIMGRDATDVDTEEFWKPILDQIPMQTGGSKAENLKGWAMKEVVAADLVNASLFKQLRDLSIGARELYGAGVDINAIDGPMKSIKDRLIVGLTGVKRSRYIWSLMGRQLQAKDLDNIAEAAAKRTAEIHAESKANVELLMKLIGDDKNDDLLNGFLEAFSQADKIHNWLDLDAYMRTKLHGFSNKNVVLTELIGVMTNSILSSVKTVQRAFAGTGHVAVAQPLQRMFGAMMSTDIVTRKANLAALYGQLEAIPEAMKVFRSRMSAHWSGDMSMTTRYMDYNKNNESWEALGKWVNTRTSWQKDPGTRVAWHLGDIARRLNGTGWVGGKGLLSGSTRTMAAMDDTFRFIMARSRAREKAMRYALDKADDLEITPQLLKDYQDDFYKKLLDADGNIDLKKDQFLEGMYKEATLTEDLTGFGQSLNQLFNQYPLIKPFFLFARTGVNGLNLTYKNTPVFGLLHRRYIDVMKATPDNLDLVRKYGISTAEDLANEVAIMKGRQAMGAATTLSMTGMYLSGNLTGNGPQDRQLRQAWIDSGDWQPRSLKIPGVGWVSYDLFEPYSIILSTIADIGDNMQLMGPEWAENFYGKMALALAGSTSSKSYLKGLTDLNDLASGTPGKGKSIAGNILNNIIPLSAARNDFGKIITPYMRELSSEMGDAIRNRNLAIEKLRAVPLPIKYDMLNGRPLRDWNPIHRFVNAVTPLAIDGIKDSPGRTLLRKSNYNTRQSTYSAPGNINLSKEPRVRSLYQKAMGEVPIEIGGKVFDNAEEALNYLAGRKDIQKSIADMNKDLADGNRHFDPNLKYKHIDLIGAVMRQAKQKGWRKLMNDPEQFPEVAKVAAEQTDIRMEQIRARLNQTESKPAPIITKTQSILELTR